MNIRNAVSLIPLLVISIEPAWSAVYRSADPFDMGAAQASNATTEIYNPAGLPRLKTPQVVGSYIWFKQDISYTGSVTEVPLHTTQNGKSSTSFSSSLPSIFISSPVTDKLAVGFSYSTPYGSPTGPVYSPNAITSFSYSELQLNTANYSGAFGYQLTEKWSFGAGLNYQTMDVIFNNVVLAGRNAVEFDNKAGGAGWWWHGGILFAPSKATRLGLTYWSQFTERLKGDSELVQLNRTSDNLKIDLPIPPTAAFSIFQALSQQWAVNVTIAYTQWSVLSNLELQNSAAGTVATEGVYNDTWRGTIGPGFKLNDHWAFDGFVRYEQLAINDDIRLPTQPGDANWSVGVGVTYNFTDKIGIKTRYIYPFFGTKDIDNTTQNGNILYVGQEDRTANILGAQLIWSF